jgi:DNA replication and repair protein RecF
VFIQAIKTYQFRNLDDCQIGLKPGFVCLIGDNGQGKTNIVEAISLISFGRSFRTNDVRDLIRWKCGEASVFADVVSEAEADTAGRKETKLGVIVKGGTRSGLVNGTECRSIAELFPLLRCVTFSPTDLSLVTGAPAERRRFLDRHTVDVEQSLVWGFVEYQRALKSKQAIIKNQEASLNASMLAPWNSIMAEAGAKIINARMRLVSRMEPILARYSKELFGDESAITVRLRGPSANLVAERSASASGGVEIGASDLARQLEEAAEKEITLGRTAAGPHRDDLVPYIFGHDARSFASQGQSRSIVLVLKLAMVELIREACGESPVVLLDDVDSELDATRRAVIFSAMAHQTGQVIITATEKRVPQELSHKISQTLCVLGGAIKE